MGETNIGVQRPREAGRPLVGGLMFWLLVLMGFAALAPCILLPEWRHYESLKIEEQAQAHRLAMLQNRIAREQRLQEAMQRDPAVIARIAQRELGFRRPEEHAVSVSVDVVSEPADAPFTARPVRPPPIVARALSWLPDYNFDRVFCDPQARTRVMVMSVGLISVAFLLFGRRGRTRLSDGMPAG